MKCWRQDMPGSPCATYDNWQEPVKRLCPFHIPQCRHMPELPRRPGSHMQWRDGEKRGPWAWGLTAGKGREAAAWLRQSQLSQPVAAPPNQRRELKQRSPKSGTSGHSALTLKESKPVARIVLKQNIFDFITFTFIFSIPAGMVQVGSESLQKETTVGKCERIFLTND